MSSQLQVTSRSFEEATHTGSAAGAEEAAGGVVDATGTGADAADLDDGTVSIGRDDVAVELGRGAEAESLQPPRQLANTASAESAAVQRRPRMVRRLAFGTVEIVVSRLTSSKAQRPYYDGCDVVERATYHGRWRLPPRSGIMKSDGSNLMGRWVNKEGDMCGRSTWCLVVVGVLSLAGCEKKVDCEAFCAKQAQCAAEIAIALRSATPEQIGELSSEDRKTLSDRQLKRCKPDCKSPTMPASMHTKWNQCLQLTDCQAFADCVYH